MSCLIRSSLKSQGEGMVARHLIGKKFEGDEAVKPDVLGLVDDAHAARAEPFKNTVVRNCLADQGAAGCVPLTLTLHRLPQVG
jgi:hypothetical protein